MDYKELLKKYMQLIIHEEGTPHVNHAMPSDFSDEELAVLKQIARGLGWQDPSDPTSSVYEAAYHAARINISKFRD